MAGYADKNGKETPRKQAKVAAGSSAEFRGYINVNLSEDQKKSFDAWASSGSVWDTLEAAIASGVNVSLKRIASEGGFLATATQRDAASPNAGLCVTARGNGAWVAFARVLFTLAYLSHVDRWEELQPIANGDRW